MKILFVAGANLRLMPYVTNYINIIDKNIHSLTLLYWDRDGQKDVELVGIKKHVFDVRMKNEISKFKKIKYFIKFKNFVKNFINKNRFLMTHPVYPPRLRRESLLYWAGCACRYIA